jgi:hypothetical protein
MNNVTRILDLLDAKLTSPVELTLYGRAALHLGFPDPLADYALTHDVDAVLWIGQAEALDENTNFWQAVEAVNEELSDQELYISHFFSEDQVILRPDWQEDRVRIRGEWQLLALYRLGNLDLLLSKLMRDDPIDQSDARFIVSRAGLKEAGIRAALKAARVPDSEEIREQFALASERLLASLQQKP